MKSAIEDPMVASWQYRNFPFSALEVMSMLIGPAIGMEKMNPAMNPASDMVNRLSVMHNQSRLVLLSTQEPCLLQML